MLRALLVGLIALAASNREADAALVPADIAGSSGAQTVSFTALVDGPAAPLDVLAGTGAEATLSAPSGLYAQSGILSTVFDLDSIMVTFANPVRGVGFSGGIVDEFFGAVSGGVDIEIGGEVLSFAVPAAPIAFGALSSLHFTTATVSVSAYDTAATSAAFLGLESMGALVAPIPLPASLPFLAAGICAMGYFGGIRGRA